MRNGDFSAFCAHYDANRFATLRIQNLPNLQLHHLDGTPYPGNIIPTGEFDPRATAILQYYPLPIQEA